MCCDAEWKREVVQDHKWDFINVNEFRKTDFLTRLKYVWRYILLFKSLAVYGLDIFTAVTMISSDRWNNAITAKGSEGVVEVKFIIAKWVFVGCIIFSFLLLGYEWYKARQVVKSQDISYAFTNLLANDYFSFKNYDNFCLFCHIERINEEEGRLCLLHLLHLQGMEAFTPRRWSPSVDQWAHALLFWPGKRMADLQYPRILERRSHYRHAALLDDCYGVDLCGIHAALDCGSRALRTVAVLYPG